MYAIIAPHIATLATPRPFFSTFIRVSGAELVQKYIGEGSRMVRELFVMARESAPAIIFMDEIDSIGSTRGEGVCLAEECGFPHSSP